MFVLLRRVLLFLLPLLTCAGGTAQVAVESKRWGYDGKAVTNRFNLVTIRVRNHADRAYRGVVRLTQGVQFGGSGVAHVVPVYLGPGDARQVQFFPFVVHRSESWYVDVRGGEGSDFKQLKAGRPAAVVLVPGGSLLSRSIGMPTFSVSAFPASVTGTDCLRAVVLDHVPAFQSSQRRAFLDWLRGGGELHICHRISDYPRFSGDLDVLNDPREAFAVGAGKVVRHAAVLGQLGTIASQLASQPPDATLHGLSNLADQMLGQLRELVRADHNWGLIYFVIVVYFVLAVPWHAWFSFRRVGYVGSIASLLGVVAVTTFVVFEVGRRGHGETSAVDSLSYAKVLAPGRYDVTQYKNVFVTAGDNYEIRHGATGSVYSTAQRNQSVSGAATTGPEARLKVDIPVFTSRSFVHRGVFTGPALAVGVRQWPAGRGMDGLEIDWGGGKAFGGFAFRGRMAMKIAWHGGVLKVSGRNTPEGALELSRLRAQGLGYNYGWDRNQRELDPMLVCTAMFRAVVAERWGLLFDRSKPGAITDADTIRLVLLCESPQFLHLKDASGGTGFGAEEGYVIYDVLVKKKDE